MRFADLLAVHEIAIVDSAIFGLRYRSKLEKANSRDRAIKENGV